MSTFDYGQFVPLNCIATDKPDKSASGDGACPDGGACSCVGDGSLCW